MTESLIASCDGPGCGTSGHVDSLPGWLEVRKYGVDIEAVGDNFWRGKKELHFCSQGCLKARIEQGC